MSTRTDTLFPYPTLFRSGRTARCGRCGRQFRRQGPRISAGTLMADDFDRAMTSPLERVARTLAGHALSRNAEGDMASAGEAVDALWGEYSDAALRSEEHTSELQSLMRSSYDVFRLKKQKDN